MKICPKCGGDRTVCFYNDAYICKDCGWIFQGFQAEEVEDEYEACQKEMDL